MDLQNCIFAGNNDDFICLMPLIIPTGATKIWEAPQILPRKEALPFAAAASVAKTSRGSKNSSDICKTIVSAAKNG